jgi:hypothetical protein
MRSALQGGSEGATGTAIAGDVNTKVLAEINTNFVRDIVHLSDHLRPNEKNPAMARSDAVDMAGRPDTWLNRWSTLRRRKQDSVTVRLSRWSLSRSSGAAAAELKTIILAGCLSTVRRRGQSHCEND